MPWDSSHGILSLYTLNFIKLNLIPIIYDKLPVNSIWWCDIVSNVMPTCHIWQVDVRFNMVWKYDVMWKLASDLVWCDKKCFLTPSQNNSLKIGIYIAANTQTFSHAPIQKNHVLYWNWWFYCLIVNLMPTCHMLTPVTCACQLPVAMMDHNNGWFMVCLPKILTCCTRLVSIQLVMWLLWVIAHWSTSLQHVSWQALCKSMKERFYWCYRRFTNNLSQDLKRMVMTI